ncbi:MAG: PilZ domain-containing protein [Deltaproteobacteria bacterium]|nr:PilZ domain-containing protein [Deltaproteobacteria bacterium]
MMKFFKDFRHDWQQNVVKRTPPPHLIRFLKKAWSPEENYADVFGSSENIFIQPGSDNISTADTEHSSIMPPFQLASPTATDDTLDSSDTQILTLKDELPLKRIDPSVVASALAAPPKVNKKAVINIINHLHFNNEQVSIHIQDKKTREEFLQQGEPGPYLGNNVTISFADPEAFDLNRHTPLNLVIDNRKSLIVFPIDLHSINKESLTLKVPDMAHSYSKRQAVRHTCEGVNAEIVQGRFNVQGVLEDINPHDLRVYINAPEDINPANPLFLKLSQDNQTHFMGECRMVRSDNEGSYIILQPVHSNRPVLTARKYPNERVRIMPQPVINFIHPLCGLAVQSKVDDISASGFSVTVPDKESLLIPGLVIPQMTLQLPGMLSNLSFTAQVIYRRKQKKDLLKYGFYILDMSLHEQRRLFDAVSKAVDPHVNVTGKVNMDSLWDLFFDSGFIYPDKYGIISPYAEALKETYRKLYEEGQDIFMHLTYQDQGQVYGHLSMVKAYENSWLIHHLAARPMRGKRTGVKTLNHFVNYLDCLYRLPVSSKTMRYNFCYYRPENIFSDYYFGGVCKIFKRREICSMDLFGYMPMSVESETGPLPDDWSLERFSKDDLILMRNYYNGLGGGMMLDAYALECRAAENEGLSEKIFGTPVNNNHNNIISMYNKIGLKRESKVFSIRHNGRIKAALIVDSSDLGVNMSELLNSIKVIVIDNTMPWSILQSAVSILGKIYGSDKIMILIFPFNYMQQQGVDCKKRYYLWVLNTNLDGNDMDIIKERARITRRKFITEKYFKEMARRRLDRFLQAIKNKK